MVFKKILELLFPSNIYCISCGGIIDRSRIYSLCDNCARMFHWANGRTCEKCGRALQDDYIHNICADCRENEHFFEKGYTCAQYGINERKLLLSFKYGGKLYIGEKIAEAMADRLGGENLDADLIIPVPMYRKKQRKRGYNQAEIISEYLSKKMAVPYSGKLLLRTGDTAAMSRLAAAERRMNMEGAFSMAPGSEEKVKGKSILLVDDIYTTGSTADACAQALMASGARKVQVITFAAGANLIGWDNAAAQVCG